MKQFFLCGLHIVCLVLIGCSKKEEVSQSKFFNESLSCPEPAVAEFSPWGKSGSQQICKIQHGPFVAWEGGYIHLRGQYDNGQKSGVWQWFDSNGNVTKQIDYSTDNVKPGNKSARRAQ